MDFNVMLSRVLRAASLDSDFYREVAADEDLTVEAFIVVAFVALVSGIGNFFDVVISGSFSQAIGSFLFVITLAIVSYVIWAYVCYFIGTSAMRGKGDVSRLLRTLGYATGPQALAFFIFIPLIGTFIGFLGLVWSIAAGVIAVREALEIETGKAVITGVLGWIVVLVVSVLALTIF